MNQFTEKARPANWLDFINSGEEHLIVLASLNHLNVKFSHVRMQISYYAVENFLKGYYANLLGANSSAVKNAIKQNHDIELLIKKCKILHPDFLNWLSILPKNRRNVSESNLSEEELKEKYTKPEFYTMLEQSQSLKYGGVSRKGEKYKVLISSKPSETVDEIIKEVIVKIGTFKSKLKWFIDFSKEIKDEEKRFLQRYLP